MRVSAITLGILFVALAWTVIARAGVWPSDWEVSLVLIAIGCLVFALGSPKERLRIPLSALFLFAVPLYLALTLIPLPGSVLTLLSPARALLLHHLETVSPSVTAAPISVNPPATFLALFTILASVATLVLICGIAARLRERPWITAIPLLLLAAFEAALGLFQVFTRSSAVAIGTYTNRDHFAGFLEMIFPFAALYGFVLFKEKDRIRSGARSALFACALWAIGALIFLSIAYSLSRMGFLVVLIEFLIIGAASVGKRKGSRLQWLLATGTAAALLAGCIFLVPDQLSTRFATISGQDKPAKELRLSLWRDTLPLIAEFPLVGCGFGGYESVFMKHQSTANEYGVEFAHNDYLQFLAELGACGFLILAGAVGAVGRDIARGLRSIQNENRRMALWACIAALVGMLLHSAADFNLYIPANLMTFAWIGGLALAIATERASPRRSKPSP